MRKKAEAFDQWIRTTFIDMNTELENLYFAQKDRARVLGVGDSLKERLRDEGRTHIVGLLAEGNTGDGFASAFGVLGNVGLYLGALRRHELTNPAREERSPFPEASSLAMHVGASLGMVPRFATAHLTTHNMALGGVRKSFTSLADEFLFIDENTRGILAFQRAADALMRIVPSGHFQPGERCAVRCRQAGSRGDAIRSNERLFERARRRALLLQCAAVLQAVPHRSPGISRRQCRRFLGDQRNRPVVGSVSCQRSVLRAAAGGQDAVHAAAGPGAPA